MIDAEPYPVAKLRPGNDSQPKTAVAKRGPPRKPRNLAHRSLPVKLHPRSKTLSLALALAAAGCGDDGSSVTSIGCNSSTDCPDGQLCVDSVCRVSAAGDTQGGTSDVAPVEDTAGLEDVSSLADVVANDVAAPKDTPPPFDPGPAPDLIPDDDAPTLIKTAPAKDATNVALPFTLQLTFSEGVKNVEDNTVSVTDVNETKLAGTFAPDDAKSFWTFKPTGELMNASPYKVTVNFPLQVIADLANNKFVGITEFTFFTAPPPNREKYAALAGKHAPVLRILTTDKPQYDIPVALDADGNYDLTNTKAWLDKATTKELTPTVYWDAFESESHYFIHYTWYFPFRNDGLDKSFENDASGATVVVEKWKEGASAERPVEVLTWFKKPGGEYVRAYATNEGGVYVNDLSNEYFSGAWPEAELFVDGRPEIAITGGVHESCLWKDEGNQAACELPLGDRIMYSESTIVLSPADAATKVKKNGSTWPRSNDAIGNAPDAKVGYKLADMLATWWPRRTQVANMFNDSFSTYSYSDNGKAKIAKFPRFFMKADKTASDGRAPWAIAWKPGDNSLYIDSLPAGQIFIDPAAHLAGRHGTPYVETAFVAASKTGFSKAWCFNPYLGIDIRGTGEVCPE